MPQDYREIDDDIFLEDQLFPWLADDSMADPTCDPMDDPDWDPDEEEMGEDFSDCE
tara:strand:+ start:1810 stop:1977 length:168 start_codon:yes stop_codon:yes gene_type:complete